MTHSLLNRTFRSSTKAETVSTLCKKSSDSSIYTNSKRFSARRRKI